MKTINDLIEMVNKGDGFVLFLGIREPRKSLKKGEEQQLNFEYMRVGYSTSDLPEAMKHFRNAVTNDIKTESDNLQIALNGETKEQNQERK